MGVEWGGGYRRRAVAGVVGAICFWQAPATAVAEPPVEPEEPPAECIGVACTGVEPEAATAALWVGGITAGALTGKALWGRRG